MGYANVFCVQEAPIRQVLDECGADDDELARQVGRGIMQLVVHNSHESRVVECALPFGDSESAFVSVGSYHSTAVAALVWTGCELRRFGLEDYGSLGAGDAEAETLDELRVLKKLDSLRSPDSIRTGDERAREQLIRRVVAKLNSVDDYTIRDGIASIYWC
jgi:hypothetical protein